jgi:hypothetical protein
MSGHVRMALGKFPRKPALSHPAASFDDYKFGARKAGRGLELGQLLGSADEWLHITMWPNFQNVLDRWGEVK